MKERNLSIYMGYYFLVLYIYIYIREIVLFILPRSQNITVVQTLGFHSIVTCMRVNKIINVFYTKRQFESLRFALSTTQLVLSKQQFHKTFFKYFQWLILITILNDKNQHFPNTAYRMKEDIKILQRQLTATFDTVTIALCLIVIIFILFFVLVL